MNSCVWWEQVSAAADGELDEPARGDALSHAQRCPSCSAALAATASLAVPPTPAGAVDPAVLTSRERRWLGGRWTRRLLLVAAVVIVAEAIPAFVRGDGLSAESHAARHLASWQIGFGVGLFVAAWLSRMSHAMLALAATFAALTVTATAIDVIGGHRGPWAESVHLVELIGVFLLWRLTPAHLLPWRRHDPPADRSRDDTPPGTLRLVPPTDDDRHAT